ncbi:hypothetical protein ACS0TY_028543 [Phlomoides rotata]
MLWMLVGLMDARTADPTRVPLRNRNERGRRGWSLREEQVLSDAMKRIVSEGWKTENGFKTGYLNLLYTYVKQVLPNTDLKPEPHINSRITMLKHTGVGLDSTTTMVDATDEHWEAFIMTQMCHMRHKSWPLYADWCEIFGQSRVTGDSAQSHLNARMPPPGSSAPTDVGEGSFRVNAENVGKSETPVGDSQTGENVQETGKTASSDRKRKLSSTSDPFVNVVHNFCNTASDRLGEIAQRIGHDQDIVIRVRWISHRIYELGLREYSRRLLGLKEFIITTVSTHVRSPTTLTLQEKLHVTALIARHAEDIDVFFSLPDDDRKEWVLMLLNDTLSFDFVLSLGIESAVLRWVHELLIDLDRRILTRLIVSPMNLHHLPLMLDQ